MASAQKFALIDMEYILKQIPSYQQANQQMESLSKQWQSQIEAKANEAKKLYEDYQKSANTLSATQKTSKEEAIATVFLTNENSALFHTLMLNVYAKI